MAGAGGAGPLKEASPGSGDACAASAPLPAAPPLLLVQTAADPPPTLSLVLPLVLPLVQIMPPAPQGSYTFTCDASNKGDVSAAPCSCLLAPAAHPHAN